MSEWLNVMLEEIARKEAEAEAAEEETKRRMRDMQVPEELQQKSDSGEALPLAKGSTPKRIIGR